jgi:amino acid transporter
MKLLSTLQSAFIGLANTAPTYGIAIAGGALLSVSGVFSPLMVLFCLCVILGIFHAGSRLNAIMPSYGSVYTWARATIHPFAGFMGAWFSLTALCLFLVYVSVYVIDIFTEAILPSLSLSQGILTLIAGLIIAAMVGISLYGIRVTARFQNFFTFIEVGLLCFFALFFVAQLLSGGVSLEAMSLQDIFSLDALTESFLLAIFFFWGWEVVFNLSEDSKDKYTTPRKSGLVALSMLALIYAGYMGMFSLLIPQSGAADMDNLFSILDSGSFPHFTYILAILAVCISIIGAIDIAIVEGAKELIAQSRDRLMPASLSRLHPESGAPRYALTAVGVIAIAGVVLSAYIENVRTVVEAGVTISTLLIACYYLLMAVTWLIYMRKNAGVMKNVFFDLAVPVLSSVLFTFAIVKTFLSFDTFTKYVFVGIVLVGCGVYATFSQLYKNYQVPLPGIGPGFSR